MALPQDEWLHLAKRAPINGQGRHHHLRERRPNLVVRNLPDRYTAYCMACKQGAVLMKEHVKVTGAPPPVKSADLTLPHDMRLMSEWRTIEPAMHDNVLGFLARKHMDPTYFDSELWFSRERMRLLVHHDGKWLGRDVTERSPQKWLTYNGQKHLDAPGEWHSGAVVVEDPFSFFKVRWALQGHAVAVYSSLGTAVSDDLMIKLLAHNSVGFFYDGDTAGWKGADTESKRLRAMGIKSFSMCAPEGFDPKDLIVQEIQHLAGGI